MTARRPSPQFERFVPFISNLPLRDQRETMERPFFSLAKRKRLKPIKYVSPDGEMFVNVYPNPEFGMATIWDADVLIGSPRRSTACAAVVRTTFRVRSTSSLTTC